MCVCVETVSTVVESVLEPFSLMHSALELADLRHAHHLSFSISMDLKWNLSTSLTVSHVGVFIHSITAIQWLP